MKLEALITRKIAGRQRRSLHAQLVGVLFANSSILTSFFPVEKWTAYSPSGENPPKILVSLLLQRLL
jgi:hypothetical protein